MESRADTALTEEIMQTTLGDEFNKALEIQQSRERPLSCKTRLTVSATDIIASLDLSKQEQGIRDLISQEASFTTVIRLLCLLSQVQGGFKQKTLEDLQRELLQTYGYQNLSLLVHLDELELLTNNSNKTKTAFAACRKPLRLIVDDVDEQAPEDIAYVYSGYAPISIRLLQGALARNGAFLGWHSIQETLKALPGKLTDKIQESAESPSSDRFGIGPSENQEPISLICFLGGCTFTEISAVRWMNQQANGKVSLHFILCQYRLSADPHLTRRPKDHGSHDRHCQRRLPHPELAAEKRIREESSW